MTTAKDTQQQSFLQAIAKSFTDSVGDIVFGMEDGTVSIFGLVFGVASSSTSSSIVLLAGATGAISAAISMMAGTFLDVESTNDQAKVQLAQEQKEIDSNLEREKQEIRDRLRTAGFNEQDTAEVVDALARHPNTLLKVEAASELNLGSTKQKNPFVQSAWMFVSDLFKVDPQTLQLVGQQPLQPGQPSNLEQVTSVSVLMTPPISGQDSWRKRLL